MFKGCAFGAMAERRRAPTDDLIHSLRQLEPHRLSSAFFARPTLHVARDLIGTLLIHRHRTGLTAGIIVETEAYTGKRDPGSHAYRGRRKRNAPMFGPPGRAYVYQCHLYPLLNVVTERAGTPGAVLLRALAPVAGLPLMRRRRRCQRDEDVARGPGRLCQAMQVDLSFNRVNLLRGPLYLAKPRRPLTWGVGRCTRIGLRGDATTLRWRFYAIDHPLVSHPPVPQT